LHQNSDNLLVLNGKHELGSGFEHYGFFADQGSGFVLQGIIYLLSFGFGFGTFADNDELILLILSNGWLITDNLMGFMHQHIHNKNRPPQGVRKGLEVVILLRKNL